MRIRYQLLLGFMVVIAAGFFVLTRWTLRDIRPQALKATEESLADTSVVLASYLETQIHDGTIDAKELPVIFDKAESRRFSAQIYELTKTRIAMRVYVTDDKGVVLFDSDGGRDVGKDYSDWNDVSRTLEGRYGARATRSDPSDIYSTVLYVAAPVYAGDRIAGVVSVGKPVQSVKLFITRASEEIMAAGLVACLAAILVSFLVSTWITRPIRRLTDYAASVRDGRRTALPALGRSEVGELGAAFEEMRDALEGKRYIEQYVQTLTHEIKSPLSSIQGAAELLREDMPAEDRDRFLANILAESARIKRLVERMLELASLESRKGLAQVEDLDLAEITREVLDGLAPVASRRGIALDSRVEDAVRVKGERFLLRQAMVNVLQNALDFTPPGGRIEVTAGVRDTRAFWSVKDTGPGIPDFAVGKVFDRFYSLRRPETGTKSTGLGLAIAREVATLHGGDVALENDPEGGARATLRLPVHEA